METGDFQKRYVLKRQDYGILYPYIVDEKVTDINWNGRRLWVSDLEKGRYPADEILTDSFVERMSVLLSNITGNPFNRMNPVLEAETEEVRVSIVHASVARSGVTISIHKIPAVRRLEQDEMIRSGYCSEEVNNFLIHCMAAHCTIAICGLPGAGKTELLKYLTKYIPAAERTITIEEVQEIHFSRINPESDCVEIKVAENFSYTEALKASIRQLPRWILLSEAKSAEVRSFLETLSMGTSGLTTLHADDVRNIPDRMKNMAGGTEDLDRIINDTFRFVDVGILVKNSPDAGGGGNRRIEQIAVFDRYGIEWKETVNRMVMLVEDGKVVNRNLPVNIRRRFREAGIENPFGGIQK